LSRHQHPPRLCCYATPDSTAGRRRPGRIHFPSDATAPFISPALTGFGLPIDRTAAQRMPMPAIYRLRFTDLTANPEVSELA
jgi:hypothetical protein